MAVFRKAMPKFPGGNPSDQVMPEKAYIDAHPEYGRIGVPMDWYDTRKREVESYYKYGVRTSKQIFRRVGEGVPEIPKPPVPPKPPEQAKQMRLSDNYMEPYVLEILRGQYPVTFRRYKWIDGTMEPVGEVDQRYFSNVLKLESDTIGVHHPRLGILVANRVYDPSGNAFNVPEDYRWGIYAHEKIHGLEPDLPEPAVQNKAIGIAERVNRRAAEWLRYVLRNEPRRNRWATTH